jgi:uncharacterized RDD family membrane protein YckC
MTNDENVVYATFWNRLVSYLIDMVVILLITLPSTIYNVLNVKSFWLYLLVTVITLLYKPLLEYLFGATIGKMFLDLKVKNQSFDKIDIKQSFLRSAILIVPPLFLLPFYYLAFQNESLMAVESINEFNAGFNAQYPSFSIVSNVIFLVVIVDLIVMLMDKTKRNISLHDQIAKTVVIKSK